MIIKQLNKMNNNKVIPNETAQQLIDLEYRIEILKQEAQLIVQQAQNEAIQIKQDTYNDTVKKVMEQNAVCIDNLNQNLEMFLSNISEKIYTVIIGIVEKLALSTSCDRIRDLIKKELDNFTDINKLKITASQDNIFNLQTAFINIQYECEWIIDNSLGKLECLVATNLWELRLNLATVEKIIKNFTVKETN